MALYTKREILDTMRDLAKEDSDIKEGMEYYDKAPAMEKKSLEDMLSSVVNAPMFRGYPLRSVLMLVCKTSPSMIN